MRKILNYRSGPFLPDPYQTYEKQLDPTYSRASKVVDPGPHGSEGSELFVVSGSVLKVSDPGQSPKMDGNMNKHHQKLNNFVIFTIKRYY
jgi:hypothetical protein